MNKKIRNDLFLGLFVFLICIVMIMVWFLNTRKKGKIVEVYHGEEIVATLDLYKSQSITVKGDISEIIIVVSYGKVYVKESGCPNQICVNTGAKSLENERITCLPNRITILIKGGDDGE